MMREELSLVSYCLTCSHIFNLLLVCAPIQLVREAKRALFMIELDNLLVDPYLLCLTLITYLWILAFLLARTTKTCSFC